MIIYDERLGGWKPRKHTYYRVCPYCGSNLDPGEICECRKQKGKEADGKQAKQPR